MAENSGLLGDTPQRAYLAKLALFNRFAAPEIKALIASLGIQANEMIIDAGCGSGLMTTWLAEQAPTGLTLGFDLSTKHIEAAHRQYGGNRINWLQASLTAVPLPPGRADWIWCNNTINHLHDPVSGIRLLSRCLKPGGHLLLGQSAFLPEMFFAWDARLERLVREACYAYYREKYGLQEQATSAVRNLVGIMQQAGLTHIRPRTILIERTAPLSRTDKRYFLEAVFQGYWGPKLQPYLPLADWRMLEQLCNPASPDFCLDRPDFHHLQTYTLVSGSIIRK